jgi:glycosyltransferase involved in cell wall biosynthesis
VVATEEFAARMPIPESTHLEPFDVSVIVVAHNEERFIGDTLYSIQRQTLLPKEIVVIDDGSSDRTAEVVMGIEGPIPIRLVTLERNIGIIPARRRAVDETSTTWIANCDADDLWAPTKLEEQWRFLCQWHGSNRVVAFGTDGVLIAEDGTRVGVVRNPLYGVEDFEDCLQSTSLLLLPHSSIVFRKADYEMVGGYDLTEIGVEDTGLLERLAHYGVVLTLPIQLISYRKKAGGGMSREYWFRQINRERLLLNRSQRQQGLDRLSYSETLDLLHRESARKRAVRMLGWKSGYYYERSSYLWLNGKKIAALPSLALSFLLNPLLWVRRVRGRLDRLPQAVR